VRRREFVAGLSMSLAAQGGHAQQSGKVYRIGYLGTNPTRTPQQAAVWEAFDQEQREHGYVEGQNVLVERRFSEGREDRLPAFAAELLQWRADVLVVASVSAARAAKEATGTVPIVLAMFSGADRLGLIASLSRPGGNITGVSPVRTR
jgi:putative tryptophan/tyrosine transport system substrate-binding protein